MKRRELLLYGLGLAATAFLLEWLGYRHLVRRLPTEAYILILALVFTALGLWTGHRLTRRRPIGEFSTNQAALKSLGISAREFEVLQLLANGQSNKEIARSLDISPNTVKTHIARLYEKMAVTRRTQAVQKAQSLGLIP